jgi:hypothetical protein
VAADVISRRALARGFDNAFGALMAGYFFPWAATTKKIVIQTKDTPIATSRISKLLNHLGQKL